MIVHYLIVITFYLINQMFVLEMEIVFLQIIVFVTRDILEKIVKFQFVLIHFRMIQMFVQEMVIVLLMINVFAKK
jgi:hypothetical protein